MSKSRNLDVYLAEVFKQFVQLKDNDIKKAQDVFKSVFDQVKQKMGEQCNFFNQFGSQVMYAGSVYDGLKVSKLDEFDMDIVIRLPICYEDGENGITLENDEPGFIKMKITKPFDNLDKHTDWETRNKVTRDWRDTDKYFLQNKFRSWMHSVVQKAVNELGGEVNVKGVTYCLTYKTSGPAYTLNVRGTGGDDFVLDVDLVPVIRFMTPRWPKGYRCIKNSKIREWLAVPKPNKSMTDERVRNRCWRLSFQEFERELMKGCQQLKTTIRLIKKLRDAQGMKAIASYYIKTLFLWKINNTDRMYWETNLSSPFRTMVQELHDAIVAGKIPYFWNESCNLIAGLKPTILVLYANKLKAVLNSIDANDAEKVVGYLLTPEELKTFKQSPFYQTQLSLSTSNSTSSSVSLQDSASNSATVEAINDNQTLVKLVELVKNLSDKLDDLTDKVSLLDERVGKLEMENKAKARSALDDLNGISFDTNSILLSGQSYSGVRNMNDNLITLH